MSVGRIRFQNKLLPTFQLLGSARKTSVLDRSAVHPMRLTFPWKKPVQQTDRPPDQSPKVGLGQYLGQSMNIGVICALKKAAQQRFATNNHFETGIYSKLDSPYSLKSGITLISICAKRRILMV